MNLAHNLLDAPFRVFDFNRIFLGDAPPLFLLEIVFRTLIMYTYTVMLLRVLGKRGMGQLSMLELAIIISFGSAVGDPMMGADVPILHGIVAITSVTIFQIGLERMINKNPRVEAVLEGRPNLVVSNGIINWECMKQDNISREDLFRALRSKDVVHLGEVQKAFFETSGAVSVFFNPPRKTNPGLPVVPEEMLPAEHLLETGRKVAAKGHYSCCNCGNTRYFPEGLETKACEVCDSTRWLQVDVNGSEQPAV